MPNHPTIRATVGCTLLLPRGPIPTNKPGNNLSRLGKICGLEPVVGLVPWIDNIGHLENRQEHTDYHAADHNTEKYNQNRLDQRSQSAQRRFNLFIQKVRDTL